MNDITLTEVNTLDVNDQTFLYDVLKFRWSKADIINIKYKHSPSLPSFEEHVEYLNSGKYKQIYKVLYKNIPIGMVYIDNSNVNGTFIVPALLKAALKKAGPLENKKVGLSAAIHMELYKKHPDIELHYATVNPKNVLSLSNLIEYGYEEIEIILAIKTKNGKIVQGKLSTLYDD
jgi:hypothetical protein